MSGRWSDPTDCDEEPEDEEVDVTEDEWMWRWEDEREEDGYEASLDEQAKRPAEGAKP